MAMSTYMLCGVFLGLACAVLAGKRDACPQIFCFMTCPNGYVTDKIGCSSCSCASAQQAQSGDCRDWRCLVPCDNGYQMDSVSGCLTCTCAPASAVDPTVPDKAGAEAKPAGFAPPMTGSAGAGNCNRMRCLVPCEGGYEVDAEGCPTCVCSSSSSGSGDANKPSGPKSLVPENAATGAKDVSSGASRNMAKLHSWLLQLLRALGLKSA